MEGNGGGNPYEFHRRVSLSRLLKTPEGRRWSGRKGTAIKGERGRRERAIGEKERGQWLGGGGQDGDEDRGNLGSGHARKISAYGEITP